MQTTRERERESNSPTIATCHTDACIKQAKISKKPQTDFATLAKSKIPQKTFTKYANTQNNTDVVILSASEISQDEVSHTNKRSEVSHTKRLPRVASNTRNDGKLLRTSNDRRLILSRNDNRDISAFSKPQYDNENEILRYAKSDNVKSQFDKTTKSTQNYIKLAQLDSAPTNTDSSDEKKMSLSFAEGDKGGGYADSRENQTFTKTSYDAQSKGDTDSSDNLQAKDLGKITAKGYKDTNAQSRQRYQSGNHIDRNLLDSSPSGNGDITSILRILPNVQYNSANQRGTQGGEIDPANISISGGLFYQNNFQLDGFNMNNDLNPAASNTNYNPVAMGATPGHSQGLNIDSSLIDSISVWDSNISAAYGGFTGGVVEANTKRATKKYGANISYQITQGNANPKAFSLTNFHIDNSITKDFLTSNAPLVNNFEPIFYKHLIRASVESKFHEKAGIVASFTTTQSFIPLDSYAESYKATVTDDLKKTQKRQSYNLFLKAHYDVSENLTLEAQYAFMPQYNNYFIRYTKDSSFDMLTGGHQAGLKALWHNKIGHFTAQSNFNFLDNSRVNSADNMLQWHYSTSKNWNSAHGAYQSEGSYGNTDTRQINFNVKLTQEFEPLKLSFWENRFNVGAELGYVNAYYERYKDSYITNPPFFYYGFIKPLKNGEVCNDAFCSIGVVDSSKFIYPDAEIKRPNGTVIGNGQNAESFKDNIGQYLSGIYIYQAGRVNLHNFTSGAFVEDDMKFDLHKGGEINTRLGLRLDYDTYMDKATIAPRFSLNYITPAPKEWQTQLTFGANRYYGRNLFAYALADGKNKLNILAYRASANESWDSVVANGNPCTKTILNLSTETTSCTNATAANDTKFNQLKVPYADEFMGGIAQNIKDFTLSVKYIYRKGKDEVRRTTRNVLGLEADSTRTANYYVYTNGGASNTNIITLSLQHTKPIITYGIAHFYLIALDYTQVKRNYADYNASMITPELENELISYQGKIMRYADKPADNFIRPFTFRLNTTHTFQIKRTKILLNNLFRWRSSYNTAVSVSGSNDCKVSPNASGCNLRDGIDSNGDGTIQDSERIDTFKKFNIANAFNWDMRLGFEVNVNKGNTVYANLDIYNVLDNQNLTVYNAIATSGPTNGQVITSASQTAVPVYELGRQFWVQVGYKF